MTIAVCKSGCKDSANRMQRDRSMLRCSLFSQKYFCKYTTGVVAKVETPPELLTKIIYSLA